MLVDPAALSKCLAVDVSAGDAAEVGAIALAPALVTKRKMLACCACAGVDQGPSPVNATAAKAEA